MFLISGTGFRDESGQGHHGIEQGSPGGLQRPAGPVMVRVHLQNVEARHLQRLHFSEGK